MVTGGSWGSTLTLAYAQAHPERVLGMIVSGVFLGRQPEIDWLYKKSGVAQFFPENYAGFAKYLSVEDEKNPIAFMVQQYTERSFEDMVSLSNAFVGMEHNICSMQDVEIKHEKERQQKLEGFSLNERENKKREDDWDNYVYGKIVSHYMHNGLFLREGELLNNMHKIGHIPLIIVQGRYDMVCPMCSAYDLHHAHPNSELRISDMTGHSTYGRENMHVKAGEDMFKRLK